jgi:hypothetical protein
MVTANDMDTIAGIQARAKDAKSGGSGKIADQNAAPKGPAALELAPAPMADIGQKPGALDLAAPPAEDVTKPLSAQDKLNKIAGMYNRGIA